MRELHAVQTIFAKALMRARESSKHIKSLQLAIGELSELDRETIRTYWAELSRGSPAERARLQFRSVKAEVQCMACFMKYHPSDGKIHCPYCGSYGAKILSGEEFYLESIEWVDA
jgi:hydrogenase nickel incorporation protein HypA/HybF